MSNFQDIPVEAAQSIAELYDKDQAIVLTWNKEHGIETVTTWGKTTHDADQAAEGGNMLKKALGWPEENCNAVSAKVLAIAEHVKAARGKLLDKFGLFGGGHELNNVFELLNKAADLAEGKEVQS